MKIKTVILAACAAALLTLPAQAIIQLSVTSTVSLFSGTDTFGFDGSTWTFQFNSSQTNYVDTSGFASVITDSASLTVSGATDPAYNGTFAIVDTSATNFMSFPNASGLLFVGINPDGQPSTFDFGPAVTVSDFNPSATPVASAPGVNDPIELSDWQGAFVVDSVFGINGSNFTFDGGTVNAAVPEPSTYAALFGLGALTFVMLRRRAVR